jgi:hypothetical protein
LIKTVGEDAKINEEVKHDEIEKTELNYHGCWEKLHELIDFL